LWQSRWSLEDENVEREVNGEAERTLLSIFGPRRNAAADPRRNGVNYDAKVKSLTVFEFKRAAKR
jgi:hypothetical protein